MLDIRPSVLKKALSCLFVCVFLAGAAFAAISDDEFFDLCAEGSLKQVVDAINGGANVNAKDNANNGRTPLIYAAAFNPDPEVIEVLINAGADVNARIDEGWSPESGYTPLMAAAVESDPKVVRALINAGADVNSRNKVGWTPLILAAASENSNPEVIIALIDAGADVDAQDKEGSTPLTAAAERCTNPEVIAVLLDSGANPAKKQEIIPPHGDHIIMMAIDYARKNENLQNTEVLERLEEETRHAQFIEKRDLELIDLCKTGSLQQINDAIRNGANVNARTEGERTTLMLAAIDCADPEVIRTLISGGADVHLRDSYGYTALMFAVDFNSNAEVAAALIEADSDVNAADNSGLTPLMIAAFKSIPETIATLLEFKADPKVKNKDNMMAIDYARRNEKLKNTDVLNKLEEISR